MTKQKQAVMTAKARCEACWCTREWSRITSRIDSIAITKMRKENRILLRLYAVEISPDDAIENMIIPLKICTRMSRSQ